MNSAHARELRKNMTEAERRPWRNLNRRQLAGMKFGRQQPIGPFVADIVCFDCRVIVDVDGGQHAEQLSHDLDRARWLEAQDDKVLRFWNNEVLAHTEAVTQAILEYIERRL